MNSYLAEIRRDQNASALQDMTRTQLLSILCQYSYDIDALRDFEPNGHDWPSALSALTPSPSDRSDGESQFGRQDLIEEVRRVEAFIEKYLPLLQHAVRALAADGRPTTFDCEP